MFSGLDLSNGTKTHYTPLEAAVRLCGQFEHEGDIINGLGKIPWPNEEDCTKWPFLHLYLSRIHDALFHNELISFCNDCSPSVDDKPRFDDPELSLRHVEVRRWIENIYPDEVHIHSFLFGQDYFPVAIGNKTLLVSLGHQLEPPAIKSKLTQNGCEAACRKKLTNLLGVAGALMTLLVQGPKSGQHFNLPFPTQDSLFQTLRKLFPSKRGLSERNLRAILKEAKLAIAETR